LLQMDQVYLAHLQQYERSLKQRNALLKTRASDVEAQLPVWDEAMAVHGAALMVRRKELSAEFSSRAGKALEDLTGGSEKFEVSYDPDVTPGEDEVETCEALKGAFLKSRREEMARGMSLTGPHRDDVKLSLNGRPLRKFGSQGQMRTGALALKLAQLEILADKCASPPLVLFDDVMAELDARRQAFFLERLKKGGQALLTGTSEADFAGAKGAARVFRVTDGQVNLESNGP
jgi:DNA replication and repair protein RecF